VTDSLVTSFSFLDATFARILGGKLQPDQPRRDDRIAVARFAQNGG